MKQPSPESLSPTDRLIGPCGNQDTDHQGVIKKSGLTRTSVQIRTAQQADLNGLVDLLTTSFHSSLGWASLIYPLIWMGIHEDLRHRLQIVSPHYRCLTAIHPAQQCQLHQAPADYLAGTAEIALRPVSAWQPHKKRLYISNLAVRREYRRQGIAQALLQCCDRLALEWGFQDLYLHVLENNAQARRLYVKAGYRLIQPESSWRSMLLGHPRQLLLHKHLAP